MPQKLRVVLCYEAQLRHVEQIQGTAPDADVICVGQDTLPDVLPSADIFCGHVKVPVDWHHAVASARLKWIQSSAAGMDHCLTPPVLAADILVSSASGLFADQVAEQALALILGITRGLPVFFRAQLKREFIRRPTRDLHRATVGMLGFGGNGRRLAAVLVPFGVRILATDVFPGNKPPHVDRLLPPDEVDQVLAAADFLVLNVPLTEITRGMIDGGALARMKPGAILINVARGPVVVEADLVTALERGQLSGAGLDVTEIEPLPETSKLWTLPNVIITPHVAAQSATRIDDVTDFFCDNLRRYLAGQPLRNLVDKQLGFPIPPWA